MTGKHFQYEIDKLRDALGRKVPKEIIAEKLNISRATLYKLFDADEVEQEYVGRLKNIDLTSNTKQPIVRSIAPARKGLLVGFNVNETKETYIIKPGEKGVPYYNVQASGGKVNLFSEATAEYIKGYTLIPSMGKCDLYLDVWGDSMYPKYKNGTIIGVKQIKDFTVIQFGHPYVVVTAENIMLKYIKKGKDKEHWMLASENPKFDEFEIEKKKVMQLFMVRGSINNENM